MKKPPHVLAIASAGGHWVQLRRLTPAWVGCRVTYVSTDPQLRDTVLSDPQDAAEVRFYAVKDANRWQKLRLLYSLCQIIWIMLRSRPDVVITTGAAPGFFALRLGRLMGKRTAWIDSIANAETLSLSGQMAGGCCDLWLTQWENLSKPNGPSYSGSVI
ncbi:UDP-N-acetylglucosamine--LPS N-acetylglucosamine transferase [Epibacterium sp. SM1969]|uniref:UDP-N-acetylglucosamine--LPS N-acetylglucosamine transferase n=1 Tax=Tritonibacter aquimaris TaxID=2663379 RepID=A0A844B211_9RHOB|nr:UDP-N-acetylglucosamine--LPS N-acetylglucosamine transferase [Tritonibacter aquimaris]MQY44131.1 UDP-N-acetylglucosamine--LPS N-acetylglucosamine transferase [Tritonibacter aquimaris]